LQRAAPGRRPSGDLPFLGVMGPAGAAALAPAAGAAGEKTLKPVPKTLIRKVPKAPASKPKAGAASSGAVATIPPQGQDEAPEGIAAVVAEPVESQQGSQPAGGATAAVDGATSDGSISASSGGLERRTLRSPPRPPAGWNLVSGGGGSSSSGAAPAHASPPPAPLAPPVRPPRVSLPPVSKSRKPAPPPGAPPLAPAARRLQPGLQPGPPVSRPPPQLVATAKARSSGMAWSVRSGAVGEGEAEETLLDDALADLEEEGEAGADSEEAVEVESAVLGSGSRARFRVGGLYINEQCGEGLNFVALAPASEKLDADGFINFGVFSSKADVEMMTDWVRGLPEGTIVLGASKSTGGLDSFEAHDARIAMQAPFGGFAALRQLGAGGGGGGGSGSNGGEKQKEGAGGRARRARRVRWSGEEDRYRHAA